MSGESRFVRAEELPAALLNKDFKRFMRELRDRLLEVGVYVERVRAVVVEGPMVYVYGDAVVVEYNWLEKTRRVRERL